MNDVERDPLQTSLRDLTIALFRHRWSFVLIVATAFVSAVIWLWVIRDQAYEVSAKLLVRIGSEQSAPPTVLDERAVFIGARTQDVNSEADILHNRDLLARVVDELGLDKPGPPKTPPAGLLPRVRFELREAMRAVREWTDEALIQLGMRDRLTPREKALALLDRSLLVTPQRESNVLVVRMFLPERTGGGKVLNTLLEFYRDFRLNVYQDESAVSFLSARVSDAESRLHEAEAGLEQFEKTGGIHAIEEQTKLLLAQLADAQGAERSAGILSREAADRLARLYRVLATDEPDFAVAGAFVEDSLPRQIVLDLTALQKERERLRVTDLDDSIRMRNNREQFKLLTGILRSNMEAALAERQSALDSRGRARSEIQAELRRLQAQHTKWGNLKREVTSLEASYLFYSKRFEEASANSALKLDRIGNVTVIEHAMDAFAPVGMRRSTLLGIVVVLSILVALAFVVLVEFFDHRVWSADVLEAQLLVPALATLPAPGGRRFFRRAPPPQADAELGAGCRPVALFLAAASRAGRFRSVILAGAQPGDAACSLAMLIAREIRETCGLRPLVLELSLGASVLAARLELDDERTLRAMAQRRVPPLDAVQSVAHGLSVIPAGPGASTTGDEQPELGGVLRRVLGELEGAFDVVIVATPGLPGQGEALSAAPAVPRALLVAESGRARIEVLARAKADLSVAGAQLLGAVLTDHRRELPGWVYRLLVGRP